MRNSFFSFPALLFFGAAIECLIAIYFYQAVHEMADAVRLMARYSGRFSFVLYLISMHWFTRESMHHDSLPITKKWTSIFAVMHLIHFGFLAYSVHLNDLPIVPLNVAGGMLAYGLIVLYPLFMHTISRPFFHFFYYYYVGFVMAMTFISRISGKFVGAIPEKFHYLGLALILFFFSRTAVLFYRQYREK